MQQIGKFILMNTSELAVFLNNLTVSRVVKIVQNHHTYIPNYSHFKGNNHFTLLQGMENSHLERGFSEIAQNLTTFPDGTVAVCRDLNKIPAGIKGANANGICIEHLGNFDNAGDVMTAEQKSGIISVNALLCKKFNLQPNTDSIVYHHWYDLNTGQRINGTGTTKSCPGTNFFGGNTEQSTQQNFIPLITSELQKLGGISTQPVAFQHGRVRVPLLNVRIGPGKNFSIVSQITQGTEIGIYNQQENWFQINAQKQWVHKDFVELS